MNGIKEWDGLPIVPVKIRFEDTYQFAAGLANVSVTRISDIDSKTDRSETAC